MSVQQFDPQDEGLKLTRAAINHVKKHMARNPNAVGIRLSLETRGCSGKAYVIDYVQEPQPEDLVYLQEEGVTLYVEKQSFEFVKGTEVDYVKEGLNERFIFRNPNIAGECGCGESFSV